MSNLRDHVLEIRNIIETGINSDKEEITGYDYLQDVLDIEWILNNDKTLKGARLLVAFGGPNIWINTATQTIEACWWSDSCELSYKTDALDLENTVNDLFNC